jgi:hypothetical protein
VIQLTYSGVAFWKDRQAGRWTSALIPPQNPYLADDGKVHLREAATS